MSCIIFWSSQPVQWHTVGVLLITVLANEHVTVLGRKRTCFELLGAQTQASDNFSCIWYFRRCLMAKLNQKSEHFCLWNTAVLNTPNPKIHLKIKEWHEELVTHLLLGHEFPAGFLELHPMLLRLSSSGDCSLVHCRQGVSLKELQTIHPSSFSLKWAGEQWNQEIKSGFTQTVQSTWGHNTA